jgi:hypothetical protein
MPKGNGKGRYDRIGPREYDKPIRNDKVIAADLQQQLEAIYRKQQERWQCR